MNEFTFATAGQIVFGAGRIQELANLARLHEMRRSLVVTGRTPERAKKVLELLRTAGAEACVFPVSGEPTLDLIRQGVQRADAEGCDSVVAIGGGSTVDAAKAIAALMRNEGDVLEYLEVIGQGRQLAHPSAPWIAVPTTAGTGAEVTSNAVLYAPEQRVKVSLRSPWALPVAAIVDPELGMSVPRQQTLASGMDTLTQLIEPYVCSRANPLTDGFCLEGLRRVARSLKRVCEDGQNIDARTDMALASLLGGLSLANSGLGVVHGFAGPLGGMFDAPHGAICAALLPHGMVANIDHVRRTKTDSTTCRETLERYRTIARCLTGDDNAEPEDGVQFVQQLSDELQVQPLRTFGMTVEDADEVVMKAQRASSMKKNPVTLSAEELKQTYLKAL
jgi:alcohol dehydrogenase class IV